MKNRTYLIVSILLSIVGLVFILVGAVSNNIILILENVIIFALGILSLVNWSTISYQWKCKNCNKLFDISLLQNIFSINGGINHKKLKCPHCDTKTWCDGIPR